MKDCNHNKGLRKFHPGVPVLSAFQGATKVPGEDMGHDTVPAMLRGGEAVLVPGAAEEMGRETIAAMNAKHNAREGLRGAQMPMHFARGEEEVDPRKEGMRFNPDPGADPLAIQASYNGKPLTIGVGGTGAGFAGSAAKTAAAGLAGKTFDAVKSGAKVAGEKISSGLNKVTGGRIGSQTPSPAPIATPAPVTQITGAPVTQSTAAAMLPRASRTIGSAQIPAAAVFGDKPPAAPGANENLATVDNAENYDRWDQKVGNQDRATIGNAGLIRSDEGRFGNARMLYDGTLSAQEMDLGPGTAAITGAARKDGLRRSLVMGAVDPEKFAADEKRANELMAGYRKTIADAEAREAEVPYDEARALLSRPVDIGSMTLGEALSYKANRANAQALLKQRNDDQQTQAAMLKGLRANQPNALEMARFGLEREKFEHDKGKTSVEQNAKQSEAMAKGAEQYAKDRGMTPEEIASFTRYRANFLAQPGADPNASHSEMETNWRLNQDMNQSAKGLNDVLPLVPDTPTTDKHISGLRARERTFLSDTLTRGEGWWGTRYEDSTGGFGETPDASWSPEKLRSLYDRLAPEEKEGFLARLTPQQRAQFQKQN